VASLAVRRRRFRAGTIAVSLVLLAAAHLADAVEPRAQAALVAAGVGFAASGGGVAGLLVGVFGAGLAPLDTPLRVAFAVGAVAIFDRATRRDSASEDLEEQALTDRLTGLRSYAFFADALRREVARARRYGGTCSLVVFDLDRFKEFNDRYGHAAGNDLLAEVGAVVRGLTRETDVAARYGGEELVVLVPGDADSAERLAERIRDAVARIRVAPARGRRGVGTTISAGIAAFPADATTGADLFAAADAALYRAKREGRDRVEVAVERSRQRLPLRRAG
jgi:diguanylate cyclase (GGDEF)-like protein